MKSIGSPEKCRSSFNPIFEKVHSLFQFFPNNMKDFLSILSYFHLWCWVTGCPLCFLSPFNNAVLCLQDPWRRQYEWNKNNKNENMSFAKPRDLRELLRNLRKYLNTTKFAKLAKACFSFEYFRWPTFPGSKQIFRASNIESIQIKLCFDWFFDKYIDAKYA